MSDIFEKAARMQIINSMTNMEFYAECFKIEAKKLREFVEAMEQYKAAKRCELQEEEVTV